MPVIIVDDSETDRYIIRRRLKRAEGFDILAEYTAGDHFVDAYFADDEAVSEAPVLVLLDINMPRQTGFDTADEIDARLSAGHVSAANCVVLMCSSSENPADIRAAGAHPRISGYFIKPLSAQDCEEIRAIWSHAADKALAPER